MLYSEEETLISGLLPEHVSVKDFEKSVQKGTATGGRLSESVEIPLSSGLKKVLKYAADEAEKMASMQVESKHLLIGLLRYKNSEAEKTLRKHGITLTKVRHLST